MEDERSLSVSGHKRTTVTIDEHEYRRLHEADLQLRRMQKARQSETSARHYQQAIRQDYERLSQRQQYYQETISRLNNQVQQLEGYLSRSLAQHQQNITRQAGENAAVLWRGVNQLIERQNAHFQSQIDELHRQQATITRRLSQVVHNLQEDLQKKNELAQSWIDAAFTIAQFIDEQYDHEKFTPGELDQLYQDILLANENFASGVPEAALTLAQQAYTRCSHLRLKLEKNHQEWNFLYYAACAQYEQAIDLLANHWIVPAIDLEGNELDIPVEVDFWSQGKLTAVAERLREIQEKLLDQSSALTTEELQDLQAKQIPMIEDEIHEARFQARIEFLSSQIRINIADIALAALEKQGFLLQQSGYDRHDMRSSFTASSRHIDGSEVVVKVVPAAEENLGNHLHVLSSDAGIRTRHELLLRAETIRRTLAGVGLNMGPVVVEGEAYRRNGATRRPARKVSETVQTPLYH